MATVKWDIRDIKSQHSSYVDNLVQVNTYICTCPHRKASAGIYSTTMQASVEGV